MSDYDLEFIALEAKLKAAIAERDEALANAKNGELEEKCSRLMDVARMYRKALAGIDDIWDEDGYGNCQVCGEYTFGTYLRHFETASS